MIWGNHPWDEFDYKELLIHLPEGEELVFRGMGPPSDGSRDIRFSYRTVDDTASEENGEYVVVVFSPFWIRQILGGRYRKLVYVMESCPAGVDVQVWEKYSGLLAEAADLVITASEKVYLEQSLRRRNLYWWDSMPEPSEDNHSLLSAFIQSMVRDEPLDELMMKQWKLRLDAYSRLYNETGGHETISYLLASYKYFLGEQDAFAALQDSFELMLIQELNGTLHSHYRFFSALEVQQGQLEKAVYTYAITAILPHEKETLARMERWASAGQLDLLEAELYLANEDYKRAEDAARKDASSASAAFRANMYIEQWMWQEALIVMDQYKLPHLNGVSRAQIRGTLRWIRNRKHEAVQELLRASLTDWNVLLFFAEAEQVEWGWQQLKERLNHGSGS